VIGDIVAFEWRYHTRQISFVAAALLFFIFGFALTATGFGPANVNIDSPFSIAQTVGTLSLLSVFVLAVFCANAVVRDREVQMEEIVFTTSVEKLPFLAGRFTGSFLAAFTAFSASIAGMFVARFMPWQDPDRLGALNPLPYLWTLLVIALPNLLFAAVVLFALATITGSVLASYAGSVLLYVLYFVGAALTNSPLLAASAPGADEGASLAALLDPFALSAFFEQTRHWTAIERNRRLLSLTGNFALNRVVWLGASFAILAGVYRIFSFRVASTRSKARAATEPPAQTTAESHYQPVAVRDSTTSAYWSATKLELRAFLVSAPFAAMTILWAALITFELVSDLGSGEYGAATFPAAGVIFGIIQQPLALLATILIIYMSGEMVWRERSLRFSEILHATPARNAIFVAAKCTALAAVIGVLTATALVAGALLQVANEWPVAPRLFLAFGWFAATPLILFAVAAIVIQTLMPHKYAGMIVVLLLAVFMQRGEIAGVEHPLFRFAGAPAVWWSDMNGFRGARGFHWLMLYWGAFVGFWLLFAIARWRGTRARIARLPAIVLSAIFVGSGAFVFYNTNVLNSHETSSEVLDWRAEYEKRYRTLARLPQPRVVAIKAAVDLYPRERRYRIRGEYTLVNDTAAPIDQVLIATRRDAKSANVTLGDARANREARFGQHLFRLERPLPPSGRATLHFDVSYAAPGFTSSEAEQTIAENGSLIMSGRAFPTIGYRAGYEIEEPRERRRRGLTAPSSAERRERQEHEELESADWTTLDLTVATSADQLVVTSGRLVSDRRNGDRRTFRFVAANPIPSSFVISSARYAVARERHDGVNVEVYHHPAHAQNVDRILRAAKESLAYYRRHFGPYAYDHLRIAETPVKNFSAIAQPGAIFFGETRGFLVDARDATRLDLVYRRVAHEVAHQWWGGNLIAADAPGGSMLTESLPKYCELVVLEQAYGRDAVRQLLSYELDLYLSGRTSEPGSEPPLSRALDQPYLYYRKGALVMHALKDLLGEQTVNAALRNLLREHGGPNGRPTTAHFLEHLYAVSPREHHALIHQWMNEVVLYDLKLDSVQSRRLPDGRFEVTMRITAAKTRDDGHALPMQESVELGVFSRDDKPLFLGKRAINSGTQTVVIVIEKEPFVAAVDPYLTRIDRNRFDNTKRVE
jgi:hypothetical protein